MTYSNPKITVDGLIVQENAIVLIKRGNDPFKDSWALPGGFVEYGEKTEQAIVREVKEETGLICEIRKLFGVYSDPHRDPRGHTISIVYELAKTGGTLKGGDDASDAQFFSLDKLPPLAFDHLRIIQDKRKEMKP